MQKFHLVVMIIFSFSCSDIFKMLKQDFIERRTHVCQVIPPQWKLDPQGQYYELDLKMCQLKELQYDFYWGKERLILNCFSVLTSNLNLDFQLRFQFNINLLFSVLIVNLSFLLKLKLNDCSFNNKVYLLSLLLDSQIWCTKSPLQENI